MKITDLSIDPKSLGSKFWLVEIVPAYEYKDNKRTEVISGYRYCVCLPEKRMEKIYIRIEGKQLIDAPEGYVEVNLTGLEVFIYWSGGQPQIGAKATGITLANRKN